MDTEPKYQNESELLVEMAGENDYTPEFHLLNEDVPIDGIVTFLYRDEGNPSTRDDGKWKVGSFPFRDHRKDDAPWAAFPDKPNGENHPVWKWTTPEDDPHESLTLSPSLGLGSPMYFHCWVRNGEIQWL